MYISMMTLDSMGVRFTWLNLSEFIFTLQDEFTVYTSLIWHVMHLGYNVSFCNVSVYSIYSAAAFNIFIHFIFFNESLLKSHSTVMQFMYGDAFNWLMSSWKFDSINFKWQTSLKGGLVTQAVLFEAVSCTVRQVTKRMHSVTVTKGIS